MTRLWRRLRATSSRNGQRGQSLIELTVAIPVVMLLLLGMLEFGFAFSHHLTLEYATREGARTGSALAAGGTGVNDIPCAVSATIPNVDDYIIAAVQRVLTGTKGQIPIGQVTEIRIYNATISDGTDPGGSSSDKWVPTINPDGSGAGSGAQVDSAKLMFSRVAGNQGWLPCNRNNSPGNTDSIGVSLVYNYQYVTPLGNFMRLGGAPQLRISDRTIMALNPDPF